MLRHWQLLQSSDKFQFGLELLGAIKVRQASSLSRPHDICNKGNFGGMLLAKFNSTTGRTKSSWDMSCPGTFPSQGLRAAAKYGTIRSVWGRGGGILAQAEAEARQEILHGPYSGCATTPGNAKEKNPQITSQV